MRFRLRGERAMRVTIVGSGYIGQALARHWRQDADLELTLTTTTAERVVALESLANRVLVLRADDATALATALGDADAAVFCHAPTGDSPVDAEGYRTTYRDGFAALQRVLPGLPRLRQIVYTGSCSVYGDAGGAWLDEDADAPPADAHARVLLESEALLASCRSDARRVCVLRLGAIHGPGRQPADRFRHLAGTTRPGDGAQHCCWIHRDDVVGAVDAAVRQGWDGVINLVDNRPWTVAELLQEICRARQLPPVRWDPAHPAQTRTADRRISNRRLHQLGYGLRHPCLVLPRLQAIDQPLLQSVSAGARASTRQRLNHNFHQPQDLVQRFLNVLQPGTYVRPHRHRERESGGGFECFVVLSGSIGLLLLDQRGELLELHRLSAEGPMRGVDLAAGQIHTLVALTADAVMLELKQGPYQPTQDKEFLTSFPPEGTAEAQALERDWRALFASEAGG
jgi:cupin fold WbuC family metalloprotein